MNVAVQALLTRITTAFCQILDKRLVGLYVHGSIAFDCFCWENSDIDFIAVVSAPISLDEKAALIQALLTIDTDAPPKGIEMSVVLERDCRAFTYPTPYLLHFSNAHKAQYQHNLLAYCAKMQGTDVDLAAHFTVINAVGISFFGMDRRSVFAPVPPAAYWDSICQDIADARQEILRQPMYMTLNLCRVLAYKQEGLVLSKLQGATWGKAHLPQEFYELITQAEAQYCGHGSISCREMLQPFAAYMLVQIYENSLRKNAAALPISPQGSSPTSRSIVKKPV